MSNNETNEQLNEYLNELFDQVNTQCFMDMLPDCIVTLDFNCKNGGNGLFKPDSVKGIGNGLIYHSISINSDTIHCDDSERIMAMIHQCTHAYLYIHKGVTKGGHYHSKEFVKMMYGFGILCLDEQKLNRENKPVKELIPEPARNIEHRLVDYNCVDSIQTAMQAKRIAMPVVAVKKEKQPPKRAKWMCLVCDRSALLATGDYHGIICPKCNKPFVRIG